MSFKDLPHEILIHILSFIHKERDLISISRVSDRLGDAVSDVLESRRKHLFLSFTFQRQLKWSYSKTYGPTPQRRFGSCLILKDNKMYVFGGSTQDATSFNDMWCFDIENNSWERVFGSGSLPPPRASAKGAYDSDHLYFYGGCMSRPVRMPDTHDQLPPEVIWTTDLHRFCIETKTWERRSLAYADASKLKLSPPTIAGQSGTHLISRDESTFPSCIILFGGFSSVQGSCIAEAYLVAFGRSQWAQIKLSETSQVPQGRIGHAACAINDHQIIVYGGYQHIPMIASTNPDPETYAMTPFNEIWLLSRDLSVNFDHWFENTWTWFKINISNDGPLETIRDFYHPQALCVPNPPDSLHAEGNLANLLFIDQCDPKSLLISQKMRGQILDETLLQFTNFVNSKLWSRMTDLGDNSIAKGPGNHDQVLRNVAPQKLSSAQLLTDKQLKIYSLSIDKNLTGTWKYAHNNSLLDLAWAPMQRLGFSAVFCEGFGVYIFGGFLPTTELSKEATWLAALRIHEWLQWIKRIDNTEKIRKSIDNLLENWNSNDPLTKSQEKFEFITLTPRSLWYYDVND